MVFTLAFLCIALQQDGARSMTVEKLLELHQQYLDRIHTLEATIENWQSTDGGKTWTLIRRDEWLKDGARERCRSWASGYMDGGGTLRTQEVWLDSAHAPGETRFLNGWNANRPPGEPPSPLNSYHSASAGIAGTESNGTLSWGPPLFMMLAPTLDEYLPAAVRLGSNVSLEKTIVGGKDCWTIGFETKVGVPAAHSVTLDPSRGYALIRHVSTTRTTNPLHDESEVLEYAEVGSGLFVPRRIRITEKGKSTQLFDHRVTRLRVNEPVAQDALAIKFPEGMRVQDRRTGSLELFHIWGGNDAPKLTFETRKQLNEYETSFFVRKQTTSIAGFLLATLGTIAAATVLLIYRKRLTAARRAA